MRRHRREMIGIALLGMLLASVPGWCAVTQVSVARGHRLDDVRQKLFRSGLVGPGHSLDAECIQAPTGGDEDHVTASGFTDVGSGFYTFDLEADEEAVEGAYKLEFRDGTTPIPATSGPRNLTQTLTVYVYEIVVISVSFLEGDTGASVQRIKYVGDPNDVWVTAPEWLNGVRNWPTAYVHDTGAKTIKVKLHGPPNYSCTIDATGDFGGVAAKGITFDGSGVYYSSSFTINQSVPSTVHVDNIGWQWRFTKQGSTSNINSTSHKMYTIFADNGGTWYNALYKTGCGAASGHDSEEGTFTSIWGAVSSLSLTNTDGDTLYYYYPVAPPVSNGVKELLVDNNARCGGWGLYYGALMATQGIFVNVGDANPLAPRNGLRVPSSTKGQGNVQPIHRAFSEHVIGRYQMVYYDPSYGTGGFNTLLSWDDSSVAEYTSDLGATWVDNQIGTVEVEYAP